MSVVTVGNSGLGSGYTQLTGALRDVYSAKLLFESQKVLRFAQFAQRKTDLLAQRGKAVVYLKMNNLTEGVKYTENQPIVSQGMQSSEIIVPVYEYANSIALSEALLKQSFIDTVGAGSKMLANNYAVTLDSIFRDTVLSTPNLILGGQGTATPPAVLSDMVAKDGFDAATIKDGVEYLNSKNTPKFLGEFFVCFAHPHQLRQLRDDAAWIEVNKYFGRRNPYLGEVGMYEGTIFIETTQMPELSNAQVIAKYGAGYTPAKGWEAVLFGENSFAWAEALPVELREDGVTDFGRIRKIAWYTIMGSAILEENSIVKFLTA